MKRACRQAGRTVLAGGGSSVCAEMNAEASRSAVFTARRLGRNGRWRGVGRPRGCPMAGMSSYAYVYARRIATAVGVCRGAATYRRGSRRERLRLSADARTERHDT